MKINRSWHQLQEAFGVRFRPYRVRYLPTKLQLETTNRCNLGCIECYRTNLDFKAKLGDLSFQNFRRIVDQFPYLRGISLFGLGEPLMNRELGDMLTYLRRDRPEVRPYITTNATLLDEARSAMLVTHRVDLTVSLNAATPETYKRTTGDTRYEIAEIIDNLKRLSAAARKADLRFTICMVIMNENVDEIPAYVRLAHEVGAREAYFGEQNYDGAGDRRDELELREPQLVRSKLKEAHELGTRLGVRVGHSKRDPSIWGSKNAFVPCKYLWKMPYVSWDGYLLPCCARPFPGVFNFGNIVPPDQDQGASFRELWFSDRYNGMRRSVARGRENGLCDGCQHLRPDIRV
ncbi:MAG: radical SAM protein [Desulfobacterales bacterium]|nr:MAG: radical SAM protein [Desulfobacterales bacterium]